MAIIRLFASEDVSPGYGYTSNLACVGNGCVAWDQRYFIKFNVSGINNIVHARLFLFNSTAYGNPTVRLRKVLGNWSESTISSDKNKQPSLSSEYIPASSGADITDIVREWINNPSTNYGIVIEADGSQGYKTYWTSKNTSYPCYWLGDTWLGILCQPFLEIITPEGKAQILNATTIPTAAYYGDEVKISVEVDNIGDVEDNIFVNIIDSDTNQVIHRYSKLQSPNSAFTLEYPFTMPNKTVNIKVEAGHEE